MKILPHGLPGWQRGTNEGYSARTNYEMIGTAASAVSRGSVRGTNCAILGASKSIGCRPAEIASYRVSGGVSMRARVLVVDDDEVYLAGIKELLEGAGYDMLVASTFEDGKRVLQDNTPDLMII